MKTKASQLLVILSGLTMVIACEKENLTTQAENDEKSAGSMNVQVNDSVLSDVPDIVIGDPDLQAYALVSQCGEDYLNYQYDRYGRLSSIRYIRRNTITPATSADLASKNVYMVDRFVYNSMGRLSELSRFNPAISTVNTSLMTVKNYRYNNNGQLVLIMTRRPFSPNAWTRIESLYYDRSGNMVKKVVKEPYRKTFYFNYEYDKSNRPVRITVYRDELSSLRFVCCLYYDPDENIERMEFFYPSRPASAVDDVIRKWVVYYKYDEYYNPFRDLKLPTGSLFEWMDQVSPSNVAAISFDNGTADKVIYYRYRYNNLGYPVVRYRVRPVADNE